MAAFRTIDSPDLRVQRSPGYTVFGTGRLEFLDRLQGINSREHYVLEFKWTEADSQLTLHSHFSDFNEADGLQVRLQKVAGDDDLEDSHKNGHVDVSLAMPGYPFKHWTVLHHLMTDDSRVRIRIEVHDGMGTQSRLLIWNDWQNRGSPVRQRITQVKERQAIADTEQTPFTFYSTGHGIRWGLELRNIQLKEARRERPYVD